MKRNVAAAIVAVLIGATGLNAASAATIHFNFGGVGMAFSDGYYDVQHHWHHWRRGEFDRYRAEHRHFSNWRHDDRRHSRR